jgi:hypothetical protein
MPDKEEESHMKHLFTIVAVTAVLLLAYHSPSSAYIPTCEIRNGMKIWYLDYADDDYTLSHPLGIREGIVEINEGSWHSKCSKDGPGTKIYVPFDPISGKDKGQMDTRWPQDVYRSKTEAERAYQRLR